MEWEEDARVRVSKAPFFIRFFIKQRAESEAEKRGLARVTTQLLDELKSKEHKPQG
jgi:hypothetical protein